MIALHCDRRRQNKVTDLLNQNQEGKEKKGGEQQLASTQEKSRFNSVSIDELENQTNYFHLLIPAVSKKDNLNCAFAHCYNSYLTAKGTCLYFFKIPADPIRNRYWLHLLDLSAGHPAHLVTNTNCSKNTYFCHKHFECTQIIDLETNGTHQVHLLPTALPRFNITSTLKGDECSQQIEHRLEECQNMLNDFVENDVLTNLGLKFLYKFHTKRSMLMFLTNNERTNNLFTRADICKLVRLVKNDDVSVKCSTTGKYVIPLDQLHEKGSGSIIYHFTLQKTSNTFSATNGVRAQIERTMSTPLVVPIVGSENECAKQEMTTEFTSETKVEPFPLEQNETLLFRKMQKRKFENVECSMAEPEETISSPKTKKKRQLDEDYSSLAKSDLISLLNEQDGTIDALRELVHKLRTQLKSVCEEIHYAHFAKIQIKRIL